MMSTPGRPASTNSLLLTPNGSPFFLGALVSTGAVVNNVTTATPFYNGLVINSVVNSTLAGKWLLVQPSAAGSLIASLSPSLGAGFMTLAQQTVLPPANNTTPGPSLTAGERVELVMLPMQGWLQWLPTSGSGNLLVWELQ